MDLFYRQYFTWELIFFNRKFLTKLDKRPKLNCGGQRLELLRWTSGPDY